MLPLKGVQVRSLVRELRSHVPDSVAKKKKRKINLKKRERWNKYSVHVCCSVSSGNRTFDETSNKMSVHL